jgi:glycerol-3-phosphate acyltransferase PlsX
MSSSISGVRVALDAMGGDLGPGVVVAGGIAAARDLGVEVLLVGPPDVLRAELAKAGAPDRCRMVEAPEVVGMAEKVSRQTLRKRSSIHVGIEMVRDGKADAFFSAGNTAACWTIAKLTLGTLEEVERPALAAVLPNVKGRTLLLDVGANANCNARNLEEFAVMGDVYANAVLHVEKPRIGLMSMGEEEGKGTELTREVHEVLKVAPLNFVGNVEGRDLFNGKVDVIIVDGFTGNVVLKASESLAESLFALLREELSRTPMRKLWAWLSRYAYRAIKKRTDAAEYGGAPLLGVKGCCVIGHGRSTPVAVMHGVRVAAEFYASGVNRQIEAELKELGAGREQAGAL